MTISMVSPPCVISIHAPVWGRAAAHKRSAKREIFQFTPPCGGGLARAAVDAVGHDFNSRPRVGAGRERYIIGQGVAVISIHAPVWGRAYTPNLENPPVADFNSRPRVGAGRWERLQSVVRRQISIHAPVWGRAGAASTVPGS